MSFSDPIASHRTDIARIVAGLFAMLGLTESVLAESALPQRIARELHRAVARVLRPAESAVRRLIVVLAARMQARIKARMKAGITPNPPPPLRLLPADFGRAGAGLSIPRFQLFDGRTSLVRALGPVRKAARGQPRIHRFGSEPLRPLPPAAHGRTDDGLANGLPIARRLQALKAALDNLPRQARRLMRALARRQKSERLKRMGPLRPGRPPGFRQRPRHHIDRILQACENFAREAVFNTS